jgi:hypothetical protein
MQINNHNNFFTMNLKFRFASFALSVLPVAAGDDVIYSAKSGLGSAKSGLGSAKGGLGSAKGGLGSAKGGLDSASGVITRSSPCQPLMTNGIWAQESHGVGLETSTSTPGIQA